MFAPRSELESIPRAIAGLGPGPLTQEGLINHVYPLFSRVRARHRNEIYLANHSLGRPLDQSRYDVQEGVEHWYDALQGAWDPWLAEIADFRRRIAALIRAPREECIVPKSNAGHGLRAVLDGYDEKVSVVTTEGEHAAVNSILGFYETSGRINLLRVRADQSGVYRMEDLLMALEGASLLVVSLVFFTTGQRLSELPRLISSARSRRVKVLVDLYHAAGVIPVDIAQLDVDFAIGGCNKYLRGGPGACWLYLHPRYLDGSVRSADAGLFAHEPPFDFKRSAMPRLVKDDDACIGSTPPVLPYYQARAGLAFVLAIGVDRLRAYTQSQQTALTTALEGHGVPVFGEPSRRGAFLALPHPRADAVAERLRRRNVIVDARDGLVRVCPDILNTETELTNAAEEIAGAMNDC